MDRATELSLLREVLELQEAGSFFLDDAQGRNAVANYCSPERFLRERDSIFRGLPQMVAHVSELSAENAFLRRDIGGLPVLLTHEGAGRYRAFLNVCRHRGTRLVDDARGCARRFTCPYHAWTWNNRGELTGVPHERDGFPEVDRKEFGLKQLACEERHGWIWVAADDTLADDLAGFLAGIGPDLDWIGSRDLHVVAETVSVRDVNWKILIEGGVESYHFKVAHRATIGPYFTDNLSTYQAFGSHLRSVLPRVSVQELATRPEESWQLRQHANLLYTIFPLSQLLVQQDHLIWVRFEPVNAARTRITLRTMAAEGTRSDTYWQRNHAITCATLTEDFVIGESIQSGLDTGANDQLTFGRFEGALHRFNRAVEQMIGLRETG
ncbi:MAG: SRPBCC family protein [Minwuia sp.]|nr:SRPBCC family protein [Minwuia sp.]